MIGPNPFYNSLFKKYVAIFGTLFNNVVIERHDSKGNLSQSIQVPIAYGPRDKFLARILQNPTGSPPSATDLPRLSFEIDNVSYAPDRKLQTMQKIVTKNDINGQNVYKKVFTPVPYDIGIKLQCMSKTMEDGLQIVEQILPYFTPEWTITAAMLGTQFNETTDIPVVLNSVQIDDQYEADFTERRVLIFILNFTIKGYFWGPVTESKIIKIVETNVFLDTTSNTQPVSTIIRPGLTPGGLPTSNADLSVALANIDETSDYGFIVNTTGDS
jgi:hypothetical protein